MNFNKLRQCYKFISFKSLHQSSYVIPKPFIYDKFLKIASYSIFFHGNLQKTLKKEPFSTSILHNTDVKTMSGGDKICLNVDYNEILKAQNDSSVLIIDVREKEEIDETGKLPGSIHIPMGDVANTLLSFSEKDFKERFKKEKPTKNTKIILSCRSGKRSGMVQEEIQKLGYENAYNYVGGWLDWESKQKV
ncbi:thiosulfate sulfurtransferase/rhodanese-like domain-containing protein 3 isoform X1 [Bombus affinis]|uniref:thiosulfate sulfurtransferase/rhodanese-like domain-containing protein 3 isoform X1 n=1 Tax=Bombus affinis TaxID=309941 RepID=UPI00021A77DD|nr:thiosulfate sulfurtransferase/rhodanese-like domain-containing protein 3 isoform X1 [Bombus affinis]